MFRVGHWLIAPSVPELLPESIARENGVLPLELNDHRFRVLIARRPDADDVIQKLEFILNYTLEIEWGHPFEVDALVDSLYSMMAARVTRCNLHFALNCSRRWLELGETEDPEQRHCPECNETVYSCLTEQEALHHAAQGHCVCLHDPGAGIECVDTTGLIDFPVSDPTSPEAQKPSRWNR